MSFSLRWRVTLEGSFAGMPCIPLKTRRRNRTYRRLSDCADAVFLKNVLSGTFFSKPNSFCCTRCFLKTFHRGRFFETKTFFLHPGARTFFSVLRPPPCIGEAFGSVWVPSGSIWNTFGRSGRRWQDKGGFWEASGRLGKPPGGLWEPPGNPWGAPGA